MRPIGCGSFVPFAAAKNSALLRDCCPGVSVGTLAMPATLSCINVNLSLSKISGLSVNRFKERDEGCLLIIGEIQGADEAWGYCKVFRFQILVVSDNA